MATKKDAAMTVPKEGPVARAAQLPPKTKSAKGVGKEEGIDEREKRKRTDRSPRDFCRTLVLVILPLKVPSPDTTPDHGMRQPPRDRQRPPIDQQGPGGAPTRCLGGSGRVGEEGSDEGEEGEGEDRREERERDGEDDQGRVREDGLARELGGLTSFGVNSRPCVFCFVQ